MPQQPEHPESPMTHVEVEHLLTTDAETFVEQALTIRLREDVMPTAMLITCPPDGQTHVTIAGISPASLRVLALTELVKRTKADAFLFWADGHVANISLTEGCRDCDGTGCGTCAGTGRHVERLEAIVTIAKTIWGFERAVGYPYMVIEGEMVRLEAIELDQVALSEYRDVFGG